MERSDLIILIARHLHKKAVELDSEISGNSPFGYFEDFKDAWVADAEELLDLIEKHAEVSVKAALGQDNVLSQEEIEDLALRSAQNFGAAEKFIFWDEDAQKPVTVDLNKKTLTEKAYNFLRKIGLK